MHLKLTQRFGERKNGDVALAKFVLANEFGEETEVVLKQYSAGVRGDPEFDPGEYQVELDTLKQLSDSEYTINLKKNFDASPGYPWNT